MTDKRNAKTGGIVKRGKTWSIILDLGDQIYRRCPECKKRYWTRDGVVATCTKHDDDVVALDAPQSGRRQEWRGGFRTKADAIAARDKARARILDGVHVVSSTLTVGEFAEDWLPSMRKQVRPTTFENYRINTSAYILPGIGHVGLQALGVTTVNEFYADLLSGAPWRSGKALAEKSVRNVHGVLAKMLGDALDEGKVARNVARQAKPPKVTKKERAIWTKDEMNTFLDSVREDRLFALWRLACRSGMRRGELAGLRWADVDLDAGELSVKQHLVIVGTTATIQEPKTKRSKRTIALDEATIEALKAHRRRQIKERFAWGEAWTDSGLVFVREGGEAIYPELLTQWFAAAAKAAGLPVIRFHDIRHSYATASLESGMPVMILSARLGHSSPALTLNVYSHALPATDAVEASRVAAALD